MVLSCVSAEVLRPGTLSRQVNHPGLNLVHGFDEAGAQAIEMGRLA
jgi:hypothetical protein